MLVLRRIVIFGSLLLVLVLFFGACSGGGSSSLSPESSPSSLSPESSPSPQPSPTPQPSEGHLYASSVDGSGSNQILLFDLPLTSNSTPSLTAGPVLSGFIAVDSSGNVAAMDSQCHIAIYNAPLSSSLTPSATFDNGTNCNPNQVLGYALAFNASGDLFATNASNQINVFTHPLSSASTPSQVITTPSLSSVSLAFDQSANLYVAAVGQSHGFIDTVVYVFAPPYTSAPTTTSNSGGGFFFTSVAVSSTQMFVSASNGFLMVSNLPAGGSGGTFTIFTANHVGPFLAVDHNQNLYVSDGQIQVFSSPLSLSSTPNLTLNVQAGEIAIGP